MLGAGHFYNIIGEHICAEEQHRRSSDTYNRKQQHSRLKYLIRALVVFNRRALRYHFGNGVRYTYGRYCKKYRINLKSNIVKAKSLVTKAGDIRYYYSVNHSEQLNDYLRNEYNRDVVHKGTSCFLFSCFHLYSPYKAIQVLYSYFSVFAIALTNFVEHFHFDLTLSYNNSKIYDVCFNDAKGEGRNRARQNRTKRDLCFK